MAARLPPEFNKKGGYDHKEALFGVPPYGGAIQQNVYYAAQDLCDGPVDKTKGFPERPVDKETGKPGVWPSPFILMVDRGGCTFVTKVRNAQHAGAAAVIIADDKCLCSREECQPEPGLLCENREPIMSDDNSGSDITIPSFLMYKEDVDPIKKALMDNKVFRMEMNWPLPAPDAIVEYELWTTPTDLVSREFLREFKQAALALGEHAKFTPHMYVYDGIKSGCRDDDGTNQCYTLCTNNGRYCATDPDNDLNKGISGADVVTESLRRECIWRVYGEKNGIGTEWWDYVNEFLYRCDTEQFFTNEDCIKDAMEHSNVNKFKIDACMQDFGGLEGDEPNELLQTQLQEKEASGIVILPAASVNGAALRGALEFAVVFKAICAGFRKGHEPEICFKCADCQDEHKCVIKGTCASKQAHVSMPVFGASLLGLALLFSCVGLIQWQRSQRQMRDQVKGILREYMPLDESNKMDSTAIVEEDGEFA